MSEQFALGLSLGVWLGFAVGIPIGMAVALWLDRYVLRAAVDWLADRRRRDGRS